MLTPYFWSFLAYGEVAGIGAAVLVGGVPTGGDEGGLCCHPFCVGDYGPRVEVCNRQQDGFTAVPELVHLFLFDVLGITKATIASLLWKMVASWR